MIRTIGIAFMALAAFGPGSAVAWVPVSDIGVPTRGGKNRVDVELAAFQALTSSFDVERVLGDRTYAAECLAVVEKVEFALRPDDGEMLGARFIKGYALLGLDRKAEATALAEQMVALEGVSRAVGFSLLLSSHLFTDDGDGVLQAIERASVGLDGSEQPDIFLAFLDAEVVRYASVASTRKEGSAGTYGLAEALLRLGWDGGGDSQLVDYYRFQVLKGRVDKGDWSGARALVQEIEMPRTYIGILVSRRYDPIFGSDFDRDAAIESILAQADARTAARIGAAPDDLKAVLARAQFLRSTGASASAYDLLEPLTRDMAAVEAAGPDAFWIVNEAVYALVDLGRADEAAALMERLIALDHDEHPDLINMTINHGVVLKDIGRYGEAVAHAGRVERQKARFASPYGMMFVNNAAVCSLAAQGKDREAAVWAEKMEDQADVNASAMTGALLCLNDLDGAEALIVKRLHGDDQIDMLIALQDYREGDDRFSSDFGRTLKERWESVVSRPSVQAAIEETGRILKIPLAVSYWGDL